VNVGRRKSPSSLLADGRLVDLPRAPRSGRVQAGAERQVAVKGRRRFMINVRAKVIIVRPVTRFGPSSSATPRRSPRSSPRAHSPRVSWSSMRARSRQGTEDVPAAPPRRQAGLRRRVAQPQPQERARWRASLSTFRSSRSCAHRRCDVQDKVRSASSLSCWALPGRRPTPSSPAARVSNWPRLDADRALAVTLVEIDQQQRPAAVLVSATAQVRPRRHAAARRPANEWTWPRRGSRGRLGDFRRATMTPPYLKRPGCRSSRGPCR
jgi:hypothetical protein